MEQTNQQPIEQSPPLNSPPSPRSRKQFSSTIIAILIVAILLIGGGVGIYLLSTRSNKITPQPITTQTTPVPTTTSSPTPNPTSNWKTYRSENLGFEFNYPRPDFYSIEEGNDRITMKHLTYTDLSITINRKLFTNHQSLKSCTEYNKEEIAQKPITCLASGEYYGQKELVANIRIDAIKAVSFFPNNFSEGGLPRVVQTIEKPFIKITSYSLDTKTFDQILSTFKFLDQNQTIDTSSKPPKNYSECIVSDKKYIYISQSLKCAYFVGYSAGQTEDKQKYDSCVSLSGKLSEGHGDGPDGPSPTFYRCELLYYNPEFVWPTDFRDCANNKGLVATKGKEGYLGEDKCVVVVDKEEATNKEVVDKLIQACMARGRVTYQEPSNEEIQRAINQKVALEKEAISCFQEFFKNN